MAKKFTLNEMKALTVMGILSITKDEKEDETYEALYMFFETILEPPKLVYPHLDKKNENNDKP